MTTYDPNSLIKDLYKGQNVPMTPITPIPWTPVPGSMAQKNVVTPTKITPQPVVPAVKKVVTPPAPVSPVVTPTPAPTPTIATPTGTAIYTGGAATSDGGAPIGYRDASGKITYINNTSSTPVTATTPTASTIGDAYGVAATDRASQDYQNYLNNPETYLASQGVTMGDIKNKTLAEMQAQIDATNALYANKLREAKIAGQGTLGSSSAIQARRGMLGSDFGAAITSNVEAQNQAVYSAIEDQRNAAIQDIMTEAQTKAETRYAAQKAAKEAGLKSYVQSLRDKQNQVKTGATEAAQAILAAGIKVEDMTPVQLADYASAHGTTAGAIKDAYSLNAYTARTAKEADKAKRAADLADKLAARAPISLSEGARLIDPLTGKEIAYNPKTYKSEGGVGGGFYGEGTGISPTAQNYINLIDAGSMTLDEVMTKLGSSKAGLALKNEVARGISMKGGRTQQGVESLQESKRIVDDLLATQAQKALGGYSSVFGGQLSTSYGDAKAKANQLSALLAKDNLGLLKGAMSDKDLAFIQAMSTGFEGQGVQSEAYVKSTLETIQDKLDKKIKKLGIGETPLPPSGQNRFMAPDGTEVEIID